MPVQGRSWGFKKPIVKRALIHARENQTPLAVPKVTSFGLVPYLDFGISARIAYTSEHLNLLHYLDWAGSKKELITMFRTDAT